MGKIIITKNMEPSIKIDSFLFSMYVQVLNGDAVSVETEINGVTIRACENDN